MQFDPISQILIPISTFLLGGGIARALDWLRRAKKDDRDFYKNELDLFKEKCSVLEERIKALELSNVPDVGSTWVRDKKGVFLDVSTAFEIEFLLPNGLRRDDVVGANLKDLSNQKLDNFLRVLDEMSVEALSSIKRYSVRYGVKVPNNDRCHLMIKEVAVSNDSTIYFVGRAYIIDDANCFEDEQT